MDIKLVKYLWKKRQWFLTKYNKKCYQIGTENLVKNITVINTYDRIKIN